LLCFPAIAASAKSNMEHLVVEFGYHFVLGTMTKVASLPGQFHAETAVREPEATQRKW
jgi:hypothetical protein